MKNLIKILAVFLLVAIVSCNGEKEEPSDAGMDVQITPDASGDSDADTDSDTDSDVDSDSDADADSDLDAGEDAGVCEHDPSERKGWVRSFGGPGVEEAVGVVTGPDGTVIVTGIFNDTVDFDPGPGEDIHSPDDYIASFISKYTGDGEYLWTRVLQSDYLVVVNASGILSDGSLIVGGYFSGTADFDPGIGKKELNSPSGDLFIARYDSEGAFEWVYHAESSSTPVFFDLATSPSDYIFATGSFTGDVNFSPGSGTNTHNSAGGPDIFTLRLNPDGGIAWSKSFGGTKGDTGRGITAGPDDSVYITGDFESLVDFDPSDGGVDEHFPTDFGSIFTLKLDSGGNYRWCNTVGGDGLDYGETITANDLGDIWVAGIFTSTLDFDPTDGVDEYTNQDTSIFLSKYLSDGSYEWTVVMGGSEWDIIGDSIVDDDGILLSGSFSGVFDFDPGVGIDERETEGTDLFLIKLDYNSNYLWGINIGRFGGLFPRSIAASLNEYLFICGDLFGSVDFDPTPCVDIRESHDDILKDTFLWKITKDGKYY